MYTSGDERRKKLDNKHELVILKLFSAILSCLKLEECSVEQPSHRINTKNATTSRIKFNKLAKTVMWK